MLFRTPATLDMSVAEALGRHLRTPEPPGPPPATIEVTSAPPTVAWHRDMKSELKVVYGFSAVTAIISVVLAFTVHLNALILLSLPVLLLGGMMHRARGHGWYELRIGAESVEVRPRGRDRARHTVSLSELEDLRVSRMPDAADMTTLNLVTDTGVVRLPMTHEQASWVKDWVETVLSDRQPG